MSRRVFPCILTSITLVVSCLFADIREQVRLDLFTAPGCAECEQIKRDVLPRLEEALGGEYELFEHDTTQATNIPLLVAYQERCKIDTSNARSSIVVDHTIYLSGYEEIAEKLIGCVDAQLASRQKPNWKDPQPPDLGEGKAEGTVQKWLRTFTPVGVSIAGLLDGFNPCAISTLIFFLSVLTIAKASRRVRFLVGFSFILASYLVYMSIGVGFLYAIRSLPNFNTVKMVMEAVIGLAMIPLAYLSFRDSFRFRKSQRADEVTLQIPDKVKRKIHTFTRSKIGWGGPVIGGFVVGTVVTILESVCTGQSYLPTLMYVLEQNPSNLIAWFLLALYNLFFILPLIVIFVLFQRGADIPSLLEWSKKNLVVIRILFGLFFTAMAIFLLWRAFAPLFN